MVVGTFSVKQELKEAMVLGIYPVCGETGRHCVDGVLKEKPAADTTGTYPPSPGEFMGSEDFSVSKILVC